MEKIKLTATEAAKTEQKYCPKHGKRYIIDKDFSLCCASECFNAAVFKMMKGSKIYQHIVSLNAVDDFHSWIQMQLLQDLREKNKPPVLNFPWLNFRMQSFYSQILVKGIVSMEDTPSKARKERCYLTIDEDILEELETINMSQSEYYHSPEKKVQVAELFDDVEKLVGPLMLSLLSEEITVQEYAKVKKMKLADVKKEKEAAAELLRIKLKNGSI